MKKSLIVLILLIILPSVTALSITLNSPAAANTTNMTTIDFSCTAADSTYSISSIALYTNTSSGTWQAVSTMTNGSTTAIFRLSSLSAGSYIWNCFAINSNNDNASAASNNTISISSLAFTGAIADISLNEDSLSSNAFDLDSYFTGATSYTVSGNSSINISLDAGNQVSIISTANWTGKENITFIGHYASSTVPSNTVLITINNVNDPPYRIQNISNQNTAKNTAFILNMSSYFADDSNLTYTITAEHITAAQNSTSLSFTPAADYEGTTSAIVTASDGSYTATSNNFTITIGTASALSITSSSPDSNPSISVGKTQDFSITASGSSLSYAWYIDDVNQNISTAAFSYTPDKEGLHTIKATATDGANTVEKTWTVTVGQAVIQSTEVSSILTSSEKTAVCGNNIVETGEDCATCTLDAACSSGSVCNKGICEQTANIGNALLILLSVTIIIILIGIAIYYFTILKKEKKTQNAFQYRPSGSQFGPPSDYTDFYNKK
ncbi:Ig-like domain-containing protein [Candidatus Woesearchaeota archaeon]|nr:Ig-like domain-containing protein [Candidatus Woesearchaeota archaeon]